MVEYLFGLIPSRCVRNAGAGGRAGIMFGQVLRGDTVKWSIVGKYLHQIPSKRTGALRWTATVTTSAGLRLKD